ncbi:hypothetical protein OF83DRAFT_49392 [Amylostereum chailletii]|nr:hypothetical protein OF83DRAFT_49392 [Amylostereum chailletii]
MGMLRCLWRCTRLVSVGALRKMTAFWPMLATCIRISRVAVRRRIETRRKRRPMSGSTYLVQDGSRRWRRRRTRTGCHVAIFQKACKQRRVEGLGKRCYFLRANIPSGTRRTQEHDRADGGGNRRIGLRRRVWKVHMREHVHDHGCRGYQIVGGWETDMTRGRAMRFRGKGERADGKGSRTTDAEVNHGVNRGADVDVEEVIQGDGDGDGDGEWSGAETQGATKRRSSKRMTGE